MRDKSKCNWGESMKARPKNADKVLFGLDLYWKPYMFFSFFKGQQNEKD